MWVVKFLRTHGLIHDCPKLLQLRTFPTIAVGGDPAGAAGLLTAMICHLAVFHPPDLLQIRVLTENPDDPDWSWLKWLPHVQHPTEADAAGANRMIVHPARRPVRSGRARPALAGFAPGGPYVVVVDLTGGKAGFPPDGRAGVTVITLGNHRGSAYRIRVAEDGTADDRLPGQTFRQVTSVADRMSPRAGRPHRQQARRMVDHRHDRRQEGARRAEEGGHRMAPAGRRPERRGGDAGTVADVHRQRPRPAAGSRSVTNSRPATSCTSTSRRARSSVPARTAC